MARKNLRRQRADVVAVGVDVVVLEMLVESAVTLEAESGLCFLGAALEVETWVGKLELEK